MDLLDLIRKQIQALPPGDHFPGLQAVLHHIEAAYKHYARGQSGDDDSYTDTIYRTNMAFEGSIKELYRVLTSKDPSKLRPYDIERYLEQQSVFRDRILGQLASYRTDWRNPSSHDYSLNFDEAEAFMAMVSVSAFTKLLVDEISERLSYLAVQKGTEEAQTSISTQTENLTDPHPLASRVVLALSEFPKYYQRNFSLVPIESEPQLIGALSGFLTSVIPNAQITTGRVIQGPRPFIIDLTGC